MSGTTSTQNLVYPTGGDSPQGAGDAVKDLALRVDARLDAHDANLEVSQFPLLSVVESKETINFDRTFIPWSFDTVLIDLGGGVDLSNDARRINLTRVGWWICGGYCDVSSAPGSVTTGLQFLVNVNNPSAITFEDTQDFQVDGSNGMHASCSTIVRVDDATNAYCAVGAIMSGTFTGGFPLTMPVTYRRMWAYWMGDL